MSLVNNPAISLLRALAAFTLGSFREIGSMTMFMLLALRKMFGANQLGKIYRQVHLIGANSLILIVIISIFTGMVLGLQGYFILTSFAAEGALGALVSLSLIRELGPVLTAIMIVGRAGSAMAAEIGVMRISEQLDALEVIDIDPMSYLIAPRMAACLIIFPLMTAIFNTVGIIGGFVASAVILDGNSSIYFYRVQMTVGLGDVTDSLIKSVVFGVIVATVSCYQGYFTHMRKDSVGSAAVNSATTSAVVLSCILILVFDYIITSLLI